MVGVCHGQPVDFRSVFLDRRAHQLAVVPICQESLQNHRGPMKKKRLYLHCWKSKALLGHDSLIQQIAHLLYMEYVPVCHSITGTFLLKQILARYLLLTNV